MSFRSFAITLFALSVGALLVYFGLHWLAVPAGSLVDWLIGVGIAWWLLAVTVLPWNAHFAALGVVDEADASRERGISVNEQHVAYARRIAARFRRLAIGLHLLTAAVLFALAYFQVIAVGYPAAAAALLLTFARPAARAYEHLAARLGAMREQVRYPRQDVQELRRLVHEMHGRVRELSERLNLDRKSSWASEVAQHQATTARELDRLDSHLTELTRTNAREHEALARQTTQEIARLSEDARFLNQVRELIRFVKDA